MRKLLTLVVIAVVALLLVEIASAQIFDSDNFQRVRRPIFVGNVPPGHVGHKPHPFGHLG
jgi:hypothetical protein